ncbi:MAG: penicillin-binding protein 2 [Solirubrobacteraceae bacterium]|nr:penicillin-binding protein 2 [Solirubrobacteraceae bacterium]
MVDPIQDRRPPITPQLALRVAVFGGVALVLFAVIFFRLWYLQVLSGDQYLAEANDNRVREMRIQAPRGEIVDRNGSVLVSNRQAIVVTLDPSKLPDSERDMAATWGQDAGRRAAKPEGRRGPQVPIPGIDNGDLREQYQRLGKVLGRSATSIHRDVIRQLAQVPYADVRLETDVPRSMLNYISERKTEFPGVNIEEIYLRRYPKKELAAQLVGTVGEISPKQLRKKRYRDVKQGTIIGQDGLEYQYDSYLRGKDGMRRIQVDALGRPKGDLEKADPTAGRTLKLSVDLGLQKTAQEALGTIGGGRSGAAVALDPRTGEVLAMASYPSFDPKVFTKPMTQAKYESLTSDENGAPIFNRAIGAQYPTGSTFKIVTAMAALETGVRGPDTVIEDGGVFKLGPQEFKNAGDAVNGSISLRQALEVSSDVYFYQLGAQLNLLRGQVLQNWAKKFSFGRRTGIDLPGETKGLVPDRQWRKELGDEELKCRKEKKVSSCGISDARPWSGGDNVNLSVGQGDLQATPLQLATAYATLANGGKRIKPHLGREVEDSQGRTIQRIQSAGSTRVKFSETNQQAIMDGLKLAAEGPSGTSTDVFKGWNHARYPVFGKTGTAERAPKADQSWYAAYVPDKDKPIVVVATVEEGGFGADTAAPIVRQMLSQWFYGKAGEVVRGDSKTN